MVGIYGWLLNCGGGAHVFVCFARESVCLHVDVRLFARAHSGMVVACLRAKGLIVYATKSVKFDKPWVKARI